MMSYTYCILFLFITCHMFSAYDFLFLAPIRESSPLTGTSSTQWRGARWNRVEIGTFAGSFPCFFIVFAVLCWVNVLKCSEFTSDGADQPSQVLWYQIFCDHSDIEQFLDRCTHCICARVDAHTHADEYVYCTSKIKTARSGAFLHFSLPVHRIVRWSKDCLWSKFGTLAPWQARWALPQVQNSQWVQHVTADSRLPWCCFWPWPSHTFKPFDEEIFGIMTRLTCGRMLWDDSSFS